MNAKDIARDILNACEKDGRDPYDVAAERGLDEDMREEVVWEIYQVVGAP